MPNLPPSIAAGQSNAPVRFSSLPASQPIVGSSPYGGPDWVINDIIKNKNPNILSLPLDLPKYHFTIVENDWAALNRRLTSKHFFKIPFPRELRDQQEVNYNTNFNYLSVVNELMNNGGLINGAMRAAGSAAGAVLGLTINNFKSVTLDVPDFKTHQLSWSFAPKTYQESILIQRFIYALKKGMAPKRNAEITNNLVLRFPQIYTLYFSPNAHWLFKFKPCVLSTLVVDYAGGGIPSMFSGNNGDNPPESVTVATNWIELEYWLDHDIKLDINGLPDRNPLDGMSWYTYEGQTNAIVNPVEQPTGPGGAISAQGPSG